MRGDSRRERPSVESVEAERLGGRAARGPALDAEDRHHVSRERGTQAVPEPTDRSMVIEHEDVLERADLGGE